MMKSISGFFILVFVTEFAFGQSEWDNLGKLRSGQKIEVVDTKLKSFKGNYISHDPDIVSLRVDNKDISIRKIDVVRVTDRQPHRLRSAFLGLGLGAALGAGIGGATAATLADKSEVQYGAGVGMFIGMAAGTA